MSEHRAKVSWSGGDAPFEYETYPRDHDWSFEGGVRVPASGAPAYGGSPERVDPEEAFVAALASCHMLTFLAIAARKRKTALRYEDDAIGFLETNDEGRLAITRVVLRPRVSFADGAAPSPEELEKIHHQAHEHCFIANSVRTQVTVEPR